MGYRKAAMMRRRQYVGGHYRTSRNGKTHWVEGHWRNDYGEGDATGCLSACVFVAFLLLVFILAAIS